MRGDRPKQPHMYAYWDAAQGIGRTDVTDLIEETIEGLGMSIRSYPDIYAHKITEALIAAGHITKEQQQ